LYWNAQPPGRTFGRCSIQSPFTSRICKGLSQSSPRFAAAVAYSPPASSSACATSEVSHTGETHG
jgi:hypothetical protein